ncbi:hypothetical protein TBLA_0F01510 [Henningerozyma blattae CBS 6284]|uniref:BHLH domain-containing protein n=1 Tax=Henningerozyma blattae (strain ATCC 34711 / CBS 6284 / DSM 70876 / NBRC 10599 / NRRL Y-10934 / UCD 77-7) TaxID=1071380 RepID=I2H5P2_HENB6|nr:hypothetical protein TBLA_0F01510 [Tetrapisispora blattae CBS 6284]CCH61694.1 hypothetical protein TBLA_0F01510 [Tetrapisispora blattae CBS 6284]
MYGNTSDRNPLKEHYSIESKENQNLKLNVDNNTINLYPYLSDSSKIKLSEVHDNLEREDLISPTSANPDISNHIFRTQYQQPSNTLDNRFYFDDHAIKPEYLDDLMNSAIYNNQLLHPGVNIPNDSMTIVASNINNNNAVENNSIHISTSNNLNNNGDNRKYNGNSISNIPTEDAIHIDTIQQGSIDLPDFNGQNLSTSLQSSIYSSEFPPSVSSSFSYQPQAFEGDTNSLQNSTYKYFNNNANSSNILYNTHNTARSSISSLPFNSRRSNSYSSSIRPGSFSSASTRYNQLNSIGNGPNNNSLNNLVNTPTSRDDSVVNDTKSVTTNNLTSKINDTTQILSPTSASNTPASNPNNISNPSSAATAATATTTTTSTTASNTGTTSGSGTKILLSEKEKLRRKKDFHNAVERRRRDLIKNKIQELTYIVPPTLLNYDSTGRSIKPNKSTILTNSIDYIKFLKDTLIEQDHQKLKLTEKFEELKNCFCKKINSATHVGHKMTENNDRDDGTDHCRISKLDLHSNQQSNNSLDNINVRPDDLFLLIHKRPFKSSQLKSAALDIQQGKIIDTRMLAHGLTTDLNNFGYRRNNSDSISLSDNNIVNPSQDQLENGGEIQNEIQSSIRKDEQKNINPIKNIDSNDGYVLNNENFFDGPNRNTMSTYDNQSFTTSSDLFSDQNIPEFTGLLNQHGFNLQNFPSHTNSSNLNTYDNDNSINNKATDISNGSNNNSSSNHINRMNNINQINSINESSTGGVNINEDPYYFNEEDLQKFLASDFSRGEQTVSDFNFEDFQRYSEYSMLDEFK